MKKKTKKSSPTPGIEPGSAGWKAAILATRCDILMKGGLLKIFLNHFAQFL
jgi:hypothetical protein